MHFKGSLLAMLLAVATSASAQCFSSPEAGPKNYDACCPKRGQTQTQDTVHGVVFEYTCGHYSLAGSSTGKLQPHKVSSAKQCAQLCGDDIKCTSASWSSTSYQCFLLRAEFPTSQKQNTGHYLSLLKITGKSKDSEPKTKRDDKDLVNVANEKADSKCAAEKDELRQQREALAKSKSDKEAALAQAELRCQNDKHTILANVNAQFQANKEAALANASSQCAVEKDEIRRQADITGQQAQSKCDADKVQSRQQVETEKEISLTKANSQCTAEKDQLRQQSVEIACQCDMDSADLQKQAKETQNEVKANAGVVVKSVSVQDADMANR